MEGRVQLGDGGLLLDPQRIQGRLLVTADAVDVDQLQNRDLLAGRSSDIASLRPHRDAAVAGLIRQGGADGGVIHLAGTGLIGMQRAKIAPPFLADRAGILQETLVQFF